MSTEGDGWFTEIYPEHRGLTFRVRSVLESRRSRFHQIEVIETEDAGKLLVLDGAVMLSTRDEFTYHEMLAHVPLFTHPEPRRVLIVGGGDGGTAREVLRHPSVERVDVVEIDEEVIEVCREHLPETAGSFDDERVRLVVADGAEFVRQTSERYDVVLVDSTDPVGRAAVLFEAPFYRHVERLLAPGGWMAAQSESPFLGADLIRKLHTDLAPIFAQLRLYLVPVVAYPSGQWSFTLGGGNEDGAGASGMADPPAPTREPPADWRLRYYTSEVHRAAFVLPPFVRELVGE